MPCQHKPSERDIEEGYKHCMWCENTGDCDGHTNVCEFHAPTWAQHDDIANPVDTDAGWDRDDKGNIIYDQRYYS